MYSYQISVCLHSGTGTYSQQEVKIEVDNIMVENIHYTGTAHTA